MIKKTQFISVMKLIELIFLLAKSKKKNENVK